MTKLRIVLLLLAFIIPSFTSSLLAQAQTPNLVHSISLAASSESGNNFAINYGGSMGTGSLAGNLMTLRLTAPHGSTISSIVDNESDAWDLGVSADSGSGGWVTTLYYLANAPAGITSITVNYSASVASWHASVMEYSGVATSSPTDGTCSNNTTTVACGSAITTTGSSDLIVATMIASGGGSLYLNALSTVTPGPGFTLDAADTQSSDADEEMVQTAPGAVTPSFTVSGSSQAFNIAAMAFKAQAGAGTNPTGMNIRHIQHVQAHTDGSSQNAYFVSTGDLLVVSFELGVTFTTYNITNCSPSNTFTKNSVGSYWPQFFYLSSGSFSTNLSCTVTNTGGGNNGHFVIYDVAGAAASSLDVASPGGEGNGGTVTDTIAPTHQSGIIFAAANDGTGPVTSFSPGIFDNTRYTGETDGGQLNNGDGWGHLFYTSAGSKTLTWTMQNSTSYMQASSIAFFAASGSQGTPPPAPTGLKATVQTQ